MATTKPDESSIKKEDNKITNSKTKLSSDHQQEKYEAMKRREREKRALHKKHMDDEYDRNDHLMKYKKSAKTNWTKHYYNGTLDEDI